jgi:hypothetical protein
MDKEQGRQIKYGTSSTAVMHYSNVCCVPLDNAPAEYLGLLTHMRAAGAETALSSRSQMAMHGNLSHTFSRGVIYGCCIATL